MKRARHALLLLALGAPLASLACESKKSSSDSARADASAGTEKYATADPKLARALQAAGSASAASNGPPAEGIFAAGAADQRHAKGVPTKVDMITDGSDPKVSLAAGADGSADGARTTSYGLAALEIAQQIGQRGATPTLDFGMILGPSKAAEGGPDWLVASVKNVSPAREQRSQIPQGMDKEVATLGGSEIRIKISPDGKVSDLVTSLAKGANPDLDRLVQNAAEALVFATVALPDRPVGAGAQWIAETRMPLSGLDVVAYRAFRVKSIAGERLHLTMDLKVYAADHDVRLAGLPKGVVLEQFDGSGQGELELVRGESVARKSDLQQRIVMVFAPPGDKPSQPQAAQAQMMTAQLVTQATFVRGDDLRQVMKQP